MTSPDAEKEWLNQWMAKKYIQSPGKFVSSLALESITRTYTSLLPFFIREHFSPIKVNCEQTQTLVVLKIHQASLHPAKIKRSETQWSFLTEDECKLRSLTALQDILVSASLHVFSGCKPTLVEDPELQEKLHSYFSPSSSSSSSSSLPFEDSLKDPETWRKLNYLKQQRVWTPSAFNHLQTQYQATALFCELSDTETKQYPYLLEEHFNLNLPFFSTPSQRGGPFSSTWFEWQETQRCRFEEDSDFLIQGTSKIIMAENHLRFHRPFIQWSKHHFPPHLQSTVHFDTPFRGVPSQLKCVVVPPNLSKHQSLHIQWYLPWQSEPISLSCLLRALGETDDYNQQRTAEESFALRVFGSLSQKLGMALSSLSFSSSSSLLFHAIQKQAEGTGKLTLEESFAMFQSCFEQKEALWKAIQQYQETEEHIHETMDDREGCQKSMCRCPDRLKQVPFVSSSLIVSSEQALLEIDRIRQTKTKKEQTVALHHEGDVCVYDMQRQQQIKRQTLYLQKNVFPSLERWEDKRSALVELMAEIWLVFTHHRKQTNTATLVHRRIKTPGKALMFFLVSQLYQRKTALQKTMFEHLQNRIPFGLRDLFLDPTLSSNIHLAFSIGDFSQHGTEPLFQSRKWTNRLVQWGQQLRVLTRQNEYSKDSAARSVQDYEGLFDPWYTPHGPSAGLVVQTTQAFECSEESDNTFLRQWIQTHGHLESLELEHPPFSAFPPPLLVMLNGFQPLGRTHTPYWLMRQLRLLRSRGWLPYSTSIYLRESTLWIDTDAGRPLKEVVNVPQWLRMFRSFGKHTLLRMTYQDLKRCHLLAQVDNAEQGILSTSIDTWVEQKDASQRYSLIHPSFLQSISTALIPFASHNMASRLSNQSGMIQQACSMSSFRYRQEVQGGEAVHIPFLLEAPLLGTAALQWWNLYEQPLGTNLRCVVTCWKGWNQDDCVLHASHIQQLGHMASLAYATGIHEEGENRLTHALHAQATEPQPDADYSGVDKDGLPLPGAYITGEKQVWVSKVSPSLQDCSEVGSTRLAGQVIAVYLMPNEKGQRLTKVRFAKYQACQEGDKVTSAHGQKGVLARAIHRHEFIHDEQGMTPSSAISPMAFPSRMTIGQLVEALCAKAVLKAGSQGDATLHSQLFCLSQQDRLALEEESSLFDNIPQLSSKLDKKDLVCGPSVKREDKKKHIHKVLKEVLRGLGYQPNGYSTLYDSVTGRMLGSHHSQGDGVANMNYVYNFALQRKALPREQAFARCTPDSMTGQPIEKEGFRVGEMERDIFIGHDAAHTLQDRFFWSSGASHIYVCSGCGWTAVVNKKDQLFYCTKCGFSSQVYQVPLSKAFATLLDILPILGSFPLLRLSPLE